MRKKWNRNDVLSIIEIEAKGGPLTYQNPSDVEMQFFTRTGVMRKSGTIYMAYWRYKQGKYDHLLYGDLLVNKEQKVLEFVER